MPFELQPTLEDSSIRLQPLLPEDFERLYAVARDPLIWEQHPNRNRYERDVFAVYFKGALESGGAFIVIDRHTGHPMGSSRFCGLNEAARSVEIAYTFIARQYWGRHYNRALKTLMLDHAFRFVTRVVFYVGVHNRRSRRAMEKLGARLTGEVVMSYYGEPDRQNAIYQFDKSDWAAARP